MNENPISELVSSALQSIREMVDVNTIIGSPIETSDGTTIIPVSRVTFGFGAGGSEFAPKKEQKPDSLFGGGSGAGVSINPVGFLVVTSEGVNMIPVSSEGAGAVEKIIESVPSAVEKVSAFIKKRKEQKETSDDE